MVFDLARRREGAKSGAAANAAARINIHVNVIHMKRSRRAVETSDPDAVIASLAPGSGLLAVVDAMRPELVQ